MPGPDGERTEGPAWAAPPCGGLRWEHRAASGGAAVGMESPGDFPGKGFQGEGVNAA